MDRDQVDAFCLSLPAATLDHPFDDSHNAWRVGGKMFAISGADGNLSFKVSDIAYEVLTESGQARPAPYLARARWVQVDLPCDWDPAELKEHLKAAHAIIAAKLTRKARAELGL